MVMSELEFRLARRQLSAELTARSVAEARLKVLNDLTEAALEAPDFKAAIGACLHIIGGQVGADCAVAYGLRPNATRLELEAEYTTPGLDADAFLDFLRRFPMHGDNSLTGEAVLHQRLIAVADLSSLDSRRFPISRTAADHGLRSWLAVPFENAGAKFGLTFLFRRPLPDMSQAAETIHSPSGKWPHLLPRNPVADPIA